MILELLIILNASLTLEELDLLCRWLVEGRVKREVGERVLRGGHFDNY